MEEQLTPEFKKAAVEVARLFDLADVDRWEDLPDGVRGFISVVEYRVLVKPLVYRDRCNLSWPQTSRAGLLKRDSLTVEFRAHNPANMGSNPIPATTHPHEGAHAERLRTTRLARLCMA